MLEKNEKILKALDELNNTKVNFGVTNERNADIGTKHEFGTARIPARAPFKTGMLQTQENAKKLLNNNIPQVLLGKVNAKEMFNAIGSAITNHIIGNITSGLLKPPLSPVTIAKRKEKGKQSASDKSPLYDTGEFQRNILHEVV